MKKEFGKWLMDIAKYVVTAVIISSVFSEMESGWPLYMGGLTVAAVSLVIGLLLVNDGERVDKKKGE